MTICIKEIGLTIRLSFVLKYLGVFLIDVYLGLVTFLSAAREIISVQLSKNKSKANLCREEEV
jgi:hypothetical protein